MSVDVTAREAVERLARILRYDEDERQDRIEGGMMLVALLGRAEKAEAERDAALKEQDRLVRAWEAMHKNKVKQSKDNEDYFYKSQRRMTELVAERDAAFAAGQEDMRERAAEKCKWHSDKLIETIRAIPLKPRP